MRLTKRGTKLISIFGILAATLMLSGCDFALLDPKGAIGLEQRKLILTAIGLMLIVVVPVICMTIYFAFKFREGNTGSKYTPDWAHSNKIEAVVWIVPIIIILILGTITWKTTHELDPFKPLASDKKPLTIEVVSLDWKWLFIYPEQGIATVNELAFPQNIPVEFKVTSNSVMNSFFIPRLGGQIYAMAGMQTKLHLIANEPGQYDGISSGYSGQGFSGMKFTAIATPTEADFNQWVQNVKKSPNVLNTTADFNKLATPNENQPVTYFSSVKPELFQETIAKFMSSMHEGHHMDKSMEMDKNMDMNQSMNMGAHAKAGVEE